MRRFAYIYYLHNGNFEPFYIGKANGIARRRQGHLYSAKDLKDTTPKALRIREELLKGNKIYSECIAKVPFDSWPRAEEYAMRLALALGFKIVNCMPESERVKAARRLGGLKRAASFTPEYQAKVRREANLRMPKEKLKAQCAKGGQAAAAKRRASSAA